MLGTIAVGEHGLKHRETFIQLDSSNHKAQTKMGRQNNTGHPPTEYQKLDSLCPRPCKMEKRR
jgi:hypothetical protein